MELMSDILHNARRKANKKACTVSADLGVSPVYIGELEKGKKIPLDGAILFKLAGYYGIDFTELLKSAYNQKYLAVRAKYPKEAE